MSTENQPIASTSKTPLHYRFHPAAAQSKGAPGASIDSRLLQTVVNGRSEKEVRAKLVELALSIKGTGGACFLHRDIEEMWTLSKGLPASGRLPDWAQFRDSLSETCESLALSNSIQTEPLPDGKTFGLLAPIRCRGKQPEIMLLVMASQKDAILATSSVQKMISSLALWLNSSSAADSDWQVNALAAVIELVANVEKQSDLKAATEETANLLANKLGCNSVAVGLWKNHRMQLKAISGISKIDQGSESSRNYLQALVESATREESGMFPASDHDNNHLLQAHKQLAAVTHSESVLSHPLLTEDEDVFGAIVFTGPKDIVDSSQLRRFNEAAAPAITSALQVVSKVKRNFLSRAVSFVAQKLSRGKQLFWLLAIVGLVAAMFLPITYRVRCNCVAEPVSRRFAVAPFDGQITLGHVEAGDLVKAGDVLADMDGRSINWELAGVTAELKQSIRTREMELKDRNVAKTVVSQLERQRLTSEEAILKYKRENLQIRSPIDGVVLSGSLERAEAASVETGKVLFEIGPTKPVRVEIAIPDDEIAQVRVGFPVKVWIDGQEEDPITAEIRKIHPRSETRDADNVFIAEIEFPNEDERLRPGMKGSARIDCEERSLGWSLFHKPMNWVRSRLTWW
ncbi:putative efflux pump membrane fusion protein [Mariniblastus fucicola]|uniref:Putative efflux pump membrane fusion protein n=1 Tax=Mariniblastus fucicola TaxID=980251 RepID=A0A5B9PCI9_9BACT|nr:putative efflux pump membrane fusion protein [Mariniblastus fucicola]